MHGSLVLITRGVVLRIGRSVSCFWTENIVIPTNSSEIRWDRLLRILLSCETITFLILFPSEYNSKKLMNVIYSVGWLLLIIWNNLMSLRTEKLRESACFDSAKRPFNNLALLKEKHFWPFADVINSRIRSVLLLRRPQEELSDLFVKRLHKYCGANPGIWRPLFHFECVPEWSSTLAHQ